METDKIFQSIASFLQNCLGNLNWKEAILHVQIQPGSLGLKGVAFDGAKNVSIQVKPSEEIKLGLLLLHKITTTGQTNKWNEMDFVIKKDSSYNVNFIWNQEKQDEVDQNNLEYLANHPNYKLPRWDWEMTKNEQSEAIFQRLVTTIKDYLWGISFTQANIFIKKIDQDFELSGSYTAQEGGNEELFTIDRYYVLIADAHQLWNISTHDSSDAKKWSLAIFTLYADDKYDIEYQVVS